VFIDSQVGVSAELPSGPHGTSNLDYSSFFDFLMNEHEAYEKIPGDRFNIDACVCLTLNMPSFNY
jgi:hypothetical protein